MIIVNTGRRKGRATLEAADLGRVRYRHPTGYTVILRLGLGVGLLLCLLLELLSRLLLLSVISLGLLRGSLLLLLGVMKDGTILRLATRADERFGGDVCRLNTDVSVMVVVLQTLGATGLMGTGSKLK